LTSTEISLWTQGKKRFFEGNKNVNRKSLIASTALKLRSSVLKKHHKDNGKTSLDLG
jgi:hypothetical protein